MSEFNEPWWLDVDWGKVRDDLHKIVLDSVLPGAEAINRNRFRQRIIACVNACAGIPTDQLEDARRSLLSAGFHMTAAERQEYIDRKSAEFREMAAKRTGVSIENDPRSVPPAHRTPLGVAIEASRPVPGTDLHEVRVKLPEAQQVPAPLAWRKDPPTSAPSVGYDCYWVLAPNGARFIVKVEGESLGGKPLIYRFGGSMPTTALDYVGYEWSGPIEPPEAPA